MMKKFVSLVGAGAMLLAVAGPTLTYGGNVAIIEKNDATAQANTGGNIQSNFVKVKESGVGGSLETRNSMTTGDASAKAKVLIVANSNVGCGCGESESTHTFAKIKNNDAAALADAGSNLQDNTVKVKYSGVGGGISG